ncbi:hypothetical protein [Sandaracinus amylolyticus]|uniref:hypothetical protein n=1 Tax=Sandaracinus amylolyticus TaxID=927083 RepID=UPI001F408A77|nr:hypothetical protein [Sandaracinus amylolyticus]UJR83759.1 Hypothetical protein I5071_58300 [Sandaracinus amylolyticus]
MTNAIGRGVVVVALVGACGACESAGESASLVHREALLDVHEYGVTECPQDLGELEVELGADASGPVTLSIAEDIIAVDVLEPELFWPINDDWSITIEPGDVMVFAVEFNCGSIEDVAGSIELVLTPLRGGAPLDSASIPIAVDVQGAP